jgi:phospholipase A1/A2
MKATILAAIVLFAAHGASAQTRPPLCAMVADSNARLACYDSWAAGQAAPLPTPHERPAVPTNPEAPAAALTPAQRAASQPSEITRFWDLEQASARDSLEIRGYRPISLAVATANSVNTQPSSPTNGPTAAATAYNRTELKINLSVRTKIGSGLLRSGDDALRDSLWFGYTQQSYWQLFNGSISRPFRATDHEPEFIYVFPHNLPLPGGWSYRMTGLGLVHQSNGQSLPLSRSWNRAYVMAAADKIATNGDRYTLQARVWERIDENASKDDNPDISNQVGRAELAGRWSFDTGTDKDKTGHTVGLVVRHSLKREARGSVRLEYLRSIGSANSGLRFHTQVFNGYGDTLLDYNLRRTVVSVGLSLVDW